MALILFQDVLTKLVNLFNGWPFLLLVCSVGVIGAMLLVICIGAAVALFNARHYDEMRAKYAEYEREFEANLLQFRQRRDPDESSLYRNREFDNLRDFMTEREITERRQRMN